MENKRFHAGAQRVIAESYLNVDLSMEYGEQNIEDVQSQSKISHEEEIYDEEFEQELKHF